MDNPGTRDDGILQVRAGDLVVVSYYDTLNDFGSQEQVADQAIFSGWTGNVSGTWTQDNSPYVLTGDIYLSGNLTIEPGVEVISYGDHTIGNYDTYSFIAEGTETDEYLFLNH